MRKEERFEIWLIARERVVLQELRNLRAHINELQEREKTLSAKGQLLEDLICRWEHEWTAPNPPTESPQESPEAPRGS